MSAMFYNARTAMAAGHERFSMPDTATTYMCLAATTSVILFTTGVVTSVSLFVLVLVSLLLPGLVVLINLLLTCLTGLVTLESLVGLEIERTTRTARGD